MRQAHDICGALCSPEMLGIAADVYHVWWDPELMQQIALTAEMRRLFVLQICDWRTPTIDLLNDRGLIGEGCIPLWQISDWVDEAGFTGTREVEVFSNRWSSVDQDGWLRCISQAYRELYDIPAGA